MQLHEFFSQEEMELLRTRAERVAAPLQEEDRAGHVTALVVIMRGEMYALPIDSITVVYQDVVVIPVPCVPNFVAGIANVRGHLVSVLDLAVLLGLERGEDTEETGLVVAQAGETTIGFRVEAVGEVIELQISQMNSVPANMNVSHVECIQGIFPDGTALLNMTAILEDPRIIVDETTN